MTIEQKINDKDYYARRLAEERARASEGGDASSIHAELAERYAELLGEGDPERLAEVVHFNDERLV